MSNFRTKTPYKIIKTLFISLTLILLITSMFLPREIFAGSGSVEEGGPPYKLKLNLLFTYDASYEVLDLWEKAFNRASELLYNSTEGQMQIGTVNVYTNNYEPLGVEADIKVFNKVLDTATANVATNYGNENGKGLGDRGFISLYKNHKYEYDKMLSLDDAAFEDSYGQVWIPNTPGGFGTFYTSEQDFPAFDDVIDKKDKFKSGAVMLSFGKRLDDDMHWIINGHVLVDTGLDHIALYAARIYHVIDTWQGYCYVNCPQTGDLINYGVFAGSPELGFDDTEEAAVALMAINGEHVLYIARKNYAGETVYDRFYSTTVVPMDKYWNGEELTSYWEDGKGSVSIVHELGHYVFGLYDEYKGYYLNNQGKWIKAGGNNNPTSFPAVAKCESLMNVGYFVNNDRTEWCIPVEGERDLDIEHNPGCEAWVDVDGDGEGDLFTQCITEQQYEYGESCWKTIVDFCHEKYGINLEEPDGEPSTELPDGHEDIIWNLMSGPFRLVVAIDKSASMVLENINDDEETEVLRDSYDQVWIPNTPDGFGTFYTSMEEFPDFDDLVDKKDNFKSGTVELSFGKNSPEDDDMHWIIDDYRLVDTAIDYIRLYSAKIYYDAGIWQGYCYVFCPLTGDLIDYWPWVGSAEFGFDDTQEAAVALMAVKEEDEEGKDIGKYVLYIARKNYAGETIYYPLYWTTEVDMAVHEEKMDLAKYGGSLFTDGFVHTADKLGVVSFSSSPSVGLPLQDVTGSPTKNAALDAINAPIDSGATDIAAALQASLDQFESAGNPLFLNNIVLLSDGRNNTGENLSSVIQACNDQGVKVFTIGLGADVDEEILQDISDGTGGKYSFAETKEDLDEIYADISEILSIGNLIRSIGEVISSPMQITKYIHVDTYTDEATFKLSWESGDLDLTLKRPDGSEVDPAAAQSNSNIEYVEREDYEFYRIQEPMAGDWQLIVDAVDVSGEETFTLNVSGKSPEVNFDIFTDKDSYTYPEEIKIGAWVTTTYPVANAEVTGTVERPDGSTVDITLFDDGLESHGDSTADDGFYSNYFDEYTEDGLYTFNMVVENTEGVPASGESEVPPEGWTPEPIDPFTREASVSVTVSEIPEESPTELALDFPLTIQYSDILSGKATLTSEGTPLENMEVEFDCMLPTETLTTDENGEVYNTSYMVEEASGTENYTVCANFYGDDDYLASYAEQYITVEKENATLTYNGDTSGLALNPISLSVDVTEEEDESPGDITLSGPVTFKIYNGETLIDTYSADIVDGSAGITIDGLEEGLYAIDIRLHNDNQYYQADPISVDLEIYL